MKNGLFWILEVCWIMYWMLNDCVGIVSKMILFNNDRLLNIVIMSDFWVLYIDVCCLC